MLRLHTLLAVAIVLNAIPMAFADTKETTFSHIESAIMVAGTLNDRADAVDLYLREAKKGAYFFEPTALDRESIKWYKDDSASQQHTVDVIVGRYVIVGCESDLLPKVVERQLVPQLDATYILLKRLFGYDPVAKTGRRILHAQDFRKKHGSCGNTRVLHAYLGCEDWKNWCEQAGVWLREPILQQVRNFLRHTPCVATVVSPPANGAGWLRWPETYVFAHLKNDPFHYPLSKSLTHQYEKDLKEEFAEKKGEFWQLWDPEPLAGLFCEILQQYDKRNTSEAPFRPMIEAMNAVTARKHGGRLRWHRPSHFLELISFFDMHGCPGLWETLHKYNCGITKSDVLQYRIWEHETQPMLQAINTENANSQMRAIIRQLKKMNLKTAYAEDLHEQTLAMLTERLLNLKEKRLAKRVWRQREYAVEWSFLGPFSANSVNEGLKEPAINECARKQKDLYDVQAGPGLRWIDDPNDSLLDLVQLHPLFGRERYKVAYAWTTISVKKDERRYLCISPDDVCKIWVNGEPLENGTVKHWKVRLATDHIIPVDLEAGRNQILVKVVNRNGPFGFYFRMTPDLSLSNESEQSPTQNEHTVVKN